MKDYDKELFATVSSKKISEATDAVCDHLAKQGANPYQVAKEVLRLLDKSKPKNVEPNGRDWHLYVTWRVARIIAERIRVRYRREMTARNLGITIDWWD